MEIWKPVYGLESRYEASSTGKIRGIDPHRGHHVGKILKTTIDDCGYEKIYIAVSANKQRTTRVHILVCLAFHGPAPTELHTVNHKDGDKKNNVPENLEWMTRQEQSIHSYHVLGNIKTRPRGHGVHWRANYTDDEIRLIRKLHKEGFGYHRIRSALGNKTSWVAIQMIVTGKTYYHVPD